MLAGHHWATQEEPHLSLVARIQDKEEIITGLRTQLEARGSAPILLAAMATMLPAPITVTTSTTTSTTPAVGTTVTTPSTTASAITTAAIPAVSADAVTLRSLPGRTLKLPALPTFDGTDKDEGAVGG